MDNQLKYVEIFTDGACKGNPGVGGWGSILVYKDSVKEISGNTNKMLNFLLVSDIFSKDRPYS